MVGIYLHDNDIECTHPQLQTQPPCTTLLSAYLATRRSEPYGLPSTQKDLEIGVGGGRRDDQN